MSSPTLRSLLGSGNEPELVFRRTFAVPVHDLRNACTSPERLARWFAAVEPAPRRVGDGFTAVLSGEPGDRARCEVVRCEDDVVAVRWRWPGEAVSTLTARFAPIDDSSSELVLHHTLGEPEHAVDYGGGWEQLLQTLARTLGTVDDDTPAYDTFADDTPADGSRADWRTMTRHPLELCQRVEAPISVVWQAFTTVDGLRSWWWRHWPDLEIELEPRQGGSYRLNVPSQGLQVAGRFLVVDEPSRLAYSWAWSDAEGVTEDEAVDIRLHADGDATVVSVRHTGPWPDDAPAQSYRQGWEFVLHELAVVARP